MSNKKNLHPPWKKGQSGNPKGRRPMSQDVREAKKLNDEEFTKACGKLLFMKVSQVKTIADSGDSNVIEALIARILVKGIRESSKGELNYFVERFLGKVVENHNFSGNLNSDLTAFIKARTDGDE